MIRKKYGRFTEGRRVPGRVVVGWVGRLVVVVGGGGDRRRVETKSPRNPEINTSHMANLRVLQRRRTHIGLVGYMKSYIGHGNWPVFLPFRKGAGVPALLVTRAISNGAAEKGGALGGL